MKRAANATLLGTRIFINAKKGTQSVAVFSEPLFELSITDDPERVGEKVKICIESFQPGNERLRRDDFKTINDPLIKLAGEKSSKAFWTKVKWVTIVLVDDKIVFCPSSNKGWKEGFKNIIHSNIELVYINATSQELGDALFKAFELSDVGQL